MKANYKGVVFEIESDEDMDRFLRMTGRMPLHLEQAVSFKSEEEVQEPKIKLKRRARNHMVWTAEEDRYVLENSGILGHRVMAKYLGRTTGSVKTRLRDLRIRGQRNLRNIQKPIPVTGLTDYERKVQGYIESGTKVKDVAKLMNVSVNVLYKTINKLGLRKKFMGQHKVKETKAKRHYRKHDNGEGRQKVLALMKAGQDTEFIAKATGYTPRTVWDMRYMFRKHGLLPGVKPRVSGQSKSQNLAPSISFAGVAKDKQDIAMQLVQSCANTKSKISAADALAFLGLSVGEFKAFMIDVFNHQKALGCKVKLEDDRIVFV